MKLQDQVCSLESAKRLKELGVKQDSYFYFDTAMKHNKIVDTNYDLQNHPEIVSAYTVAELINMLTNIRKCDILIPCDVDNVAEYLAKELISDYEKRKI